MKKKFFLKNLSLFIFILLFSPVKQNVLISFINALSVSYTVTDTGGQPEPYLQPSSEMAWLTRIVNNESEAKSGTLYASIDSTYLEIYNVGDWSVEGGSLRYDYNLRVGEAIDIRWWSRTKNRCPNATNSVTSSVYNSSGVMLASDTAYPLARAFLTLQNLSGDSIRVYTYANGVLQYSDGTPLAVGGNLRIEIWKGGINGGSLFSCSNPFSYSFNVTGVAGATYSCSVPSAALSNNCIAEHTANCTKIVAGPTATPVPGVPTATSTPVGCNRCPGGTLGTWCAGNSTACGDASGYVLTNPCSDVCTDPNTLACCVPTDTSCPAQINVEKTTYDCLTDTYAKVFVRQDSRAGNTVDCGCGYYSLEVKIKSSPAGSGVPSGYHVCTVYNSCGTWSSYCNWNITNMQDAPDNRRATMPVGPYPAGNYVLEVYYGGHTADGGSLCSDPICTVSDGTALGTCPLPTFPVSCGSPNCPVETTKTAVPLTNGDFEAAGDWSVGVPWLWLPTTYNATNNYPSRHGPDLCGASWNYCAGKWNASSTDYNLYYPITGLKKNTSYLVGIEGRGRYNNSEEYNYPYISMKSGSIASTQYLVTNSTAGGSTTCLWNTLDYENIYVSLLARGRGWLTYAANFDNLRLWECVAPSPTPTPTQTLSPTPTPTPANPWFQVMGAGIKAKQNVQDSIPLICASLPTCKAAMTVAGVGSDNGLVSGVLVDNDGDCEDSCKYGDPNDWVYQANIVSQNCRYQDLYNRFYLSKGVGETHVSDVKMSDLSDSGLIFVSGNLTIDEDNIVVPGDFLMVVVSGAIGIEEGVKNVEGVFVADGGIVAGGSSTDRLDICGSLCTAGNVSFSRSYTDQTENGGAPATKLNFRPDFAFNLPGALTKTLSGWREGN
jgi:hypothetical protein